MRSCLEELTYEAVVEEQAEACVLGYFRLSSQAVMALLKRFFFFSRNKSMDSGAR
jgi:hypothetical protein